ncbi:hypothetical protein RB195_016265 [Necator americanus]|uniref:Uncharacterized protein n=1 Tax=Necator americanus TaxID=51031 RepID=A0ABR1E8Q6_NECAM
MMCPEKPKNKPDEHIDDDDLAPQEPTPAKSKETKEDSETAAALPNKQTPATETEPDPPKKENKIHPVHTEATHFYSWLTAQDNNARRSSEILFRPKAV